VKRPYRVLRDVHLGAALLTTLLLLVYALSAFQMAYFRARPEPRESTRSLVVDAAVEARPRPLARWLMTEHGVRGELVEVRERRDGFRLRIERPGTVERVAFDAATRTASVTTERYGVVWLANRLHHAAGFGNDDWLLDAWGALVAIGSLALLAVAATGLAMWFARHRAQRYSTAVFVVSLGAGFALLVWVRLS
jgi:hypothetical protein